MKRIMALVAMAWAVSPSSAHKVRVDFNHDVHFSCYKTYRWAPTADSSSPHALFPNQLMQQRIAGFIEEALAARGLQRVAAGGDLLLSYRVNVTEEPLYTTISDGPGCGWGFSCGWAGGWGAGWAGGWGGGLGWSTTTVQTIYYGTLIVNLVDSGHKQLVFQGTSTQTISSRPEKNTRKLSKAVEQVFEKYPPQG
jgi:hypothetical protein